MTKLIKLIVFAVPLMGCVTPYKARTRAEIRYLEGRYEAMFDQWDALNSCHDVLFSLQPKEPK